MDISDQESSKNKADAEPADIDEAYSASIVEGSVNSEDTIESIIFSEDFNVSETASAETENTESTDITRTYSREPLVDSSDIEETIEEFLQSTIKWQVAFSLVTDIVADVSNKVTEHFTKIEKFRESATNLKSLETKNITIENTESSDVDRASSESSAEESLDIKEIKRKIEKFLELSQYSHIGFSTVNTVVADIADKVTEELIEIEKTQKIFTVLKPVKTANIKICPDETAKNTISEPNNPDRANSANYVDELKNKEDTLEYNTLKVDIVVPKTISAKIESTESTDVISKSANIEETCSFSGKEEHKKVDKFEESIEELNVATNTQVSTTEIAHTTTFESINVFSDCEVELAKCVDKNKNVEEGPASVEKSEEKRRKPNIYSSKFKWVRNQTAKSDDITSPVITPSEKPKHNIYSSKFKWVRNQTAKGDDITSSEKPKHNFKSPEHYKEFVPKSLTTGPPTSPCPPESKKVPAVKLCPTSKEFVPKSLRVDSSTSSDLKSKKVSATSLNINSKEFVPKSLRVEPSTSSGLLKPNEVAIEPSKVEPLTSSDLPKPKEISAESLNSKEYVPRSLIVEPSTSSGLLKPNEVVIESSKVEPLTSSDLHKPKEISAESLNLNSKESVATSLAVEPSTSSGLLKPNEVAIEPSKVEPLTSPDLPKPKEISAESLNLNSKESVAKSLAVEPSTSSGNLKPNEVAIEPSKVEPLTSSNRPKPKEISAESLNSKESVPTPLVVEPSTSSGLLKPNEVAIEPSKIEPLTSSDLPKPKEISAEYLNFKESVATSLAVESSTSSDLPEPNEVAIEPSKVEPVTFSDRPKPKEISEESLNLNFKESVATSLAVEPSTSSGLPEPNEVAIEPSKIEPVTSSDLPKPKEISAESLNSKESVPTSLVVEPSTSSGLLKPNEVAIEPSKVELFTSSDLPKPKEISAESLNLNSKESVTTSLAVEPSTSSGLLKPNEVAIEPSKVEPVTSSDLPKPKEISAESLNLNFKESVATSLAVETSTSSGLLKPNEVAIEPSKVEPATSSDLPKPKEISAESLNSKESVPTSLVVEPSISSGLPEPNEVAIEPSKVEPVTSSDLPKPKEISEESLNLNFKESVATSLAVEPSTSSGLPEPNEVAIEPSKVEPLTSSDLPKPKEISAESLNLNSKESVATSLAVESSTSSGLLKPNEVSIEPLKVDPVSTSLSKPKKVSTESLNYNCKEFVPRSFVVESSTSPGLPKLKEAVAESLRVEHTTSSAHPILKESSYSVTPMEVPIEDTSKVFNPKDVLTPEIPVHSFLATLDAVLLVLEGTLAGAYRISQNYTGPSIPLVIKNTMHSVRLSLETLRTHFGYTEQECFEPLSSILRDLLAPAVTLFCDICPELAYEIIDFYPEVKEPKPEVPVHRDKQGFVIYPRNVYGNTVYERYYPLPEPQNVPRIPLYTNSFEETKLGVFVTPDGFIRMILPFTFEIDLTIDGAIYVRNIKDKTMAAISGCGNFSGLATGLCRVHQRGKVLELRITDEFSNKNMYGKIGVRGVYFGGTDTPANLHLKDNGETIVSPINFSDLDTDFIRDVFVNHSLNGPANYEACCVALKESKKKTLIDGSIHFCWRNIKITQYKNGEVVVNRKNGDFMIWCSPEVLNLYNGTEKKGIIKVVTPMTRVVSTIMSTPILQHEKFFLANLGNQWVYYNIVDFLASNQVYSAGYTDVTEEKITAAAVGSDENL